MDINVSNIKEIVLFWGKILWASQYFPEFLNDQAEVVHQYKHPGTVIYNKLTAEHHVDAVCKKALCGFNVDNTLMKMFYSCLSEIESLLLSAGMAHFQ